ncbi:MAG TPA: glycosyltransferase family 1 protein [Caldithrix abyssi]|uniref:Glycosyltransferase family 1 protein n=1 Tax=Caldithrix abyssi TaxID=187145 RepID=A0A7V1PSZ0_CALAY|nr:glycosyltransferase family 1 protein [Caldithrix abyssi]
MKKIYIFSEDFPPYSGGIAQWALGMAQSLAEAGHRVSVFTRRRADFPVRATGRPFEVCFIEGQNWKQGRSYYCRQSLKNRLRSEVPDIVIATTWNVARGLKHLCRRHGVKLVTVIHGLEVTRKMPLIKRRWLQSTLLGSHKVIAVSRFTREAAVSRYNLPEEHCRVLPNGVDAVRFQPGMDISPLKERYGLAEDEKVILTLARVIRRKGHDYVIRALEPLVKKYAPLRYIICGPGDEAFINELRELARKLKLEQHVTFTGYVDSAELPVFYNLADVYIMPSREIAGDTEGFGITYLEANACEKPVIGGASGGVVDAIVDGETGYLVPPTDVKAIEERLDILLGDKARARNMGRAGRERILNEYTWQALAGRLMKIIDEKE